MPSESIGKKNLRRDQSNVGASVAMVLVAFLMATIPNAHAAGSAGDVLGWPAGIGCEVSPAFAHGWGAESSPGGGDATSSAGISVGVYGSSQATPNGSASNSEAIGGPFSAAASGGNSVFLTTCQFNLTAAANLLAGLGGSIPGVCQTLAVGVWFGQVGAEESYIGEFFIAPSTGAYWFQGDKVAAQESTAFATPLARTSYGTNPAIIFKPDMTTETPPVDLMPLDCGLIQASFQWTAVDAGTDSAGASSVYVAKVTWEHGTYSRPCSGIIDRNCTVPCKDKPPCICAPPGDPDCMNHPVDCDLYAPDIWHVPPNPTKSVCWDPFLPIDNLQQVQAMVMP